MANYKLQFHDPSGRIFYETAVGKPDDINEYMRELATTQYHGYSEGNNLTGRLYNMQNIACVNIIKIEEVPADESSD